MLLIWQGNKLLDKKVILLNAGKKLAKRRTISEDEGFCQVEPRSDEKVRPLSHYSRRKSRENFMEKFSSISRKLRPESHSKAVLVKAQRPECQFKISAGENPEARVPTKVPKKTTLLRVIVDQRESRID